jgi:hypothetical protein
MVFTCAATAETRVIIANTRAAGIASPQIRSKGGLMLHAIPRTSEAELAGRNSGLETVANNLRVLSICFFLGSFLAEI